MARPSILSFRIILSDNDEHGGKSSLELSTKHGGDEITGHVEAITRGRFDFVAEVAFEGYIRTWVSENNGDPFRVVVRDIAELKLLSQVTRSLSDPSSEVCKGDLWTYHLPFSFVVPQRLISAQSDVHDEFLRLCPSTKTGPTFLDPSTGHTYGQPAITYVVKIRRIFVGGLTSPVSLWLKDEHEVTIKPLHPPAPPIDPSQFPHDYRTHTNRPVRDRYLKCPFAMLTVSAAEPDPLNTWTSMPSSSTAISLQLELAPTGRHPREFDLFGQRSWQPVVTYHVRSRTFFSTRILTRVPTRRDVKSNPHIRIQDRKTQEEKRECGALAWSRHCRSCRPTNSDSQAQETSEQERGSRVSSAAGRYDEHDGCHWTATLTVPITAPKSLLPTFLSQLAAHQYALVLTVEIKGLRLRVRELVVPLQVIHFPPATALCPTINNTHGDRRDGHERQLPSTLQEAHSTDVGGRPSALPLHVGPPSYEVYQ